MKKLPLILSLAFVSSHAQTMDADAPPAPPQIPVTFSTPPAPAAGQPQGGRTPLGGAVSDSRESGWRERGGHTTPPTMADKYFGTPSVGNQPAPLSRQEEEALAISNRWREGKTTASKPIAGKNGEVIFVFGAPATVVCAVLQICDVALQEGEQVNSINLGDTARWMVEPAITGRGANEVQHLIIKPLDIGLETSMVVTTNRRTYHMRLKSHRSRYMSHVAFEYPEEIQAKWAALAKREVQDIANNTLPGGEYLGDLHFNYDISGSARWKPLRVYNDGRKTIIEMPEAMNQTEAPTLLVVRDGGLFSSEEQVMVNYRVQNNRYIVDAVFDRAILIAGVGLNQDRITITRKE